LGTLALTVLFGATDETGFILGLSLWCSVFDRMSVGLIFWARTASLTLDPERAGLASAT
jgi:hypothetical protein